MQFFKKSAILFLLVPLSIQVNSLKAQSATPKKVFDLLGIADMQYLSTMSSMLKDMEDSPGITGQNMAKKIRLTSPAMVPALDTITDPLKLPYNDDLTMMLFIYALHLFKAAQLPLYKKFAIQARVYLLTRTAFADSLTGLESKAIVNTILVGLESGTSHQLPYPTRLINAVIDKVKINNNTATLLYMAFEYTKKDAIDVAGVLLYNQFQRYY